MTVINRPSTLIIGILTVVWSHILLADNNTNPNGEFQTTIQLTNALGGWKQTGIFLTTNDMVDVSAIGSWDADGLILAPRHVIWYRIGGDGAAENIPSDDFQLRSAGTGELELAIRPPGFYWFDDAGTFPGEMLASPPMPVGFDVTLTTQASLETDATDNDPEFREKQQHQHIDVPPKDFDYLRILGQPNVWSAQTIEGHYVVTGDPKNDSGIIKLAVDIELTDTTLFAFDWNYVNLPAAGPETLIPGHDYLSVALEFDNGQDLTWMWSKYLPKGTHFRCPLPWWDERETHYVLESGQENLGMWQSHKRNVLADYSESISGEAPKRIVGVWFIANNIFAKQPALARFKELSISDNGITLFEY